LLRRDSGPWLVRYLSDLLPPDAASDLTTRLMRLQGVQRVVFEREGLVWTTDLGDEIGATLLRTGSYEGPEIAAVLRWMAATQRSDGLVIDVGANIGTTSVPFARAGFRVLALEPVPSNVTMLRANIESNSLSSLVRVVPVAVTDANCAVGMWTGEGSGQAEVAVDGEEPALLRWGARGHYVQVDGRPLADLLAQNGVVVDDVSLVWADVQGAETSVIRTGPQLWAAGVPLYLEVDPASLALHAGLDAFHDAVTANFTRFIPRDDLLQDRCDGSPIERFRSWAAGIPSNRYSDALLLP
jgi:FkbM family methyltransferase